MTQATRLETETFRAPAAERTATILLRALAGHGVRAAFGIPGGSAGALFDALADVPELDLVSTRHETTAVFAAIGHARATGVPALVLVTAGPGVTNTITGVAAAALEEVPVIVLGGDVSTSAAGRGAFQDGSPLGIDVAALMRSVTRWSSVINGAGAAGGAAERAWGMATGARPGPVFLSVPFDVAQERAFAPRIVEPYLPSPVPDSHACTAAAHSLMAAQRPLLVLGNGARAGAREALALAERLGMPVVATGHAKGTFPESHPLYLGIIGNAGHSSANEYIASRPDVVCVVGSRVGDFCTNGWRLDLSGTKATIQIDREALLIGRNLSVSLGIVGDARTVLHAIAQAIPEGAPRALPAPPQRRTKPWSVSAPPGLVKPQAALAALAEAFPQAVWCSDIGEHMGLAQHYLTIDRPERFHCMSGLASMGSGLGAAVGIKHASRHSTVIALVGDGGFNMFASEVLTCVEQRLGIVFAIFNDGRWNMVEHGFRAVFRRKPSNLPGLTADLAAVARGYGAAAEVIDDVSELDASRLRALVRPDLPLVLDIRTDPSEVLSVDSRSAALIRAKEVL